MKVTAFLFFTIAALVVWELEDTSFLGSSLLQLLWLLSLLAIPVLLAIGAAKRSRRLAWMSLVPFAVFFTSGLVAGQIQQVQIAAAEDQGDQLAAALEAHRARTKEYPESLAALVPRDLDRVPATEMGVFRSRRFGYVRHANDSFTLAFEVTGWQMRRRGPKTAWHWRAFD